MSTHVAPNFIVHNLFENSVGCRVMQARNFLLVLVEIMCIYISCYICINLILLCTCIHILLSVNACTTIVL